MQAAGVTRNKVLAGKSQQAEGSRKQQTSKLIKQQAGSRQQTAGGSGQQAADIKQQAVGCRLQEVESKY